MLIAGAPAIPPTQAEQALRANVINVYLGAMQVDDQSVTVEDAELVEDVDIDFSTLPGGGIFVEMPLIGERVSAGLEAGAGIGWKTDDTSFSGRSIDGDTTIRVDIDNGFLLCDLEMGLFTRIHLGQRVSLYAGGGPALVYGRHEVEDESVDPMPVNGNGTTVILNDDEAADVTVGYYGRAGLDFELANGFRVGFGAKLLGAELDFDDTVGTTDIDGVFYFLNLGQRLD